MDTLDDYRKLPCPNCGQVGTIYVEHTSAQFKCRSCHTSGFDPHGKMTKKQPEAVKVPVKAASSSSVEGYVPIPAGTAQADIVEEYITVKDNGIPKKKAIRRVYCPRITTKEEPFDPNDPTFQFQLYLGLAQKGKNRRRYNQDLIRRARKEGKVKNG